MADALHHYSVKPLTIMSKQPTLTIYYFSEKYGHYVEVLYTKVNRAIYNFVIKRVASKTIENGSYKYEMFNGEKTLTYFSEKLLEITLTLKRSEHEEL